MGAKEFRAMTDKDLEAALDNARQEMFNLRFQLVTGKLPDTSRLGLVRRDVARLLTIRRERELPGVLGARGEREG
jgi:large subunit ribosomal protein L29